MSAIKTICPNAIFVGVIFGLTATNYDEGTDCNEDMTKWLYVMGGFHALVLLNAIL
jgi:hypothetical protein